MARISLKRASEAIADLDPVMASLRDRSGKCRLGPTTQDGPFAALVRMIVYQQLAASAARAIFGRVEDAIGKPMTPRRIARVADPTLRAAGLSEGKLRSIRDLSARAGDGRLELDRLPRRSDERVIEELVQVRGIGEWTAQMFLMFELRRLDVWPVLDLGVRKGYQIAYGLDELPTSKELLPLGERFRPYRSVAAWYLWRATDEAAGR